VPVNDDRAHSAANKLVCEHQPSWAGSNDQNIRVHSLRGAIRGLRNPSKYGVECQYQKRFGKRGFPASET